MAEWTKAKVEEVLGEAGYIHNGVSGCYTHPVTRHSINLYDWVNGREKWREIAENERLPQPPQVIATITPAWWQISLMEDEEGEKFIKIDRAPMLCDVGEWDMVVNAINDMVEKHNEVF